MTGFCVYCVEKEAALELLRQRHYEEIQCMQSKLDKMRSENDALIMDVAFYGGAFTNLSCDNK